MEEVSKLEKSLTTGRHPKFDMLSLSFRKQRRRLPCLHSHWTHTATPTRSTTAASRASQDNARELGDYDKKMSQCDELNNSVKTDLHEHRRVATVAEDPLLLSKKEQSTGRMRRFLKNKPECEVWQEITLSFFLSLQTDRWPRKHVLELIQVPHLLSFHNGWRMTIITCQIIASQRSHPPHRPWSCS